MKTGTAAEHRVAANVSGTSVWTGRALQAESDDLEVIGLALLYPALERNVCVPGHHGYPRASDLILGKAQRGRSCHQITDATARPFLHLSSFQLADLGGKANYCYRDQLQTWGAAAIPFHAAAFVTRAS